MPRSMDESSSSAPTPEPLERKMTHSLLALSGAARCSPTRQTPTRASAFSATDGYFSQLFRCSRCSTRASRRASRRGLRRPARTGATSSSGAGARLCNDFPRRAEPWRNELASCKTLATQKAEKSVGIAYPSASVLPGQSIALRTAPQVPGSPQLRYAAARTLKRLSAAWERLPSPRGRQRASTQRCAS